MIPEQRRIKILDKLEESNIYTLDNLTEELGVSRITIQRDVNLLAKKGLLYKVHGGVKLKKDRATFFETRFDARLKQNYEKKLEIAKKALNYVDDNSTIFIDSSTTCYVFAKELFKEKFIDLNIITTSPAILFGSLQYPDLKIISTGGQLRQDFNMLGGNWVEDFLGKVNLDSAFISAAGVSVDRGITSSNVEIANVLAKVLAKSKEVNLLVDSSKFFKLGMLNISPIDNFKRIITDKDLDEKIVSDIKDIKSTELVI